MDIFFQGLFFEKFLLVFERSYHRDILTGPNLLPDSSAGKGSLLVSER